MSSLLTDILFTSDTCHGGMFRTSRLPRVHDRFDENYLLGLLAEHPELLPVNVFRPDIGELQCIGREVPTRDSGNIQ